MNLHSYVFFFFFSSRRRHTRYWRDWSSDVCSSDLSQTFLPRGGIRGMALLASHSLNYRLLHYGIVSALHEGVATKQTKRRHRAPAQHAEALNRFLGVLRASRDVTTGGRQPRRQQPLIDSQ